MTQEAAISTSSTEPTANPAGKIVKPINILCYVTNILLVA
jgi:hypothetical protein